MGKIDRSQSNLYTIPKGAFIRNKVYVYINISNKYVSPDQKKAKGTRGYTGHDSICIGVLQNPENGKSDMFYANKNYYSSVLKSLPEPPKFADSRSVGLTALIKTVAKEWKISNVLAEVFGTEDSQLVLDLAAYTISRESSSIEHFQGWARDNVIFSEDIFPDTYLDDFLNYKLTISKIKLFKEKWASRNIGDGKMYLFHDSNSQAEGVSIVSKEHAVYAQVNTSYVLRQSDGLPLTYLSFPNSITDIDQTQEMLQLIKNAEDVSYKKIKLTLIYDSGSISEKNLKQMDQCGIGYILMLRTNSGMYDKLADSAVEYIKSDKYKIYTNGEDEMYGITKDCLLYENGPICRAQILWCAEKYRNNRNAVINDISAQRQKLEDFIGKSGSVSYTEKSLKWIPDYFNLELESGEPIRKDKYRKIEEVQTFVVKGYRDNEIAIDRQLQKTGIVIMVSSDEISAQDTVTGYSQKDQILMNHLITDESKLGKGFIWFVASILYSIFFIQTSFLRAIDDKMYSVSSMVKQLEAIKADRDILTNKWQRRYNLTKFQHDILECFKISEQEIDECIANLNE